MKKVCAMILALVLIIGLPVYFGNFCWWFSWIIGFVVYDELRD